MTSPETPRHAPPRWSLAFVGFYLSCAGVALGATFAGGGYLFFGSKGWLWFGIVMVIVSIVTCFLTLSAERRAASQQSKPGSHE